VGRKLQALLAAGAITALTFLPALPAQAATGYDRCPDNHYCMFSGLDGGGDIVAVQGDVANLGAMNDHGKSDWNRTDSWIHLNSEVDFAGCEAVTAPRDKGNFFSTYRDFFGSLRFDGANGPSCGGPRD